MLMIHSVSNNFISIYVVCFAKAHREHRVSRTWFFLVSKYQKLEKMVRLT